MRKVMLSGTASAALLLTPAPQAHIRDMFQKRREAQSFLEPENVKLGQ